MLLWEKGLDLKLVGPPDYKKICSRFEYFRGRQIQALNLLVEAIHLKVVRERKPIKGAKSIRELMREDSSNALAMAAVVTYQRNIEKQRKQLPIQTENTAIDHRQNLMLAITLSPRIQKVKVGADPCGRPQT